MPSRTTTSLPGKGTVLAVLWVTLARCLGQSSWPGCDNGKVLLDTDLPKDAAHWDCPGPLWSQPQRLYSIDTVYDPEPAREACMSQHITYSHSIPNSGAFRPVCAESGEYLYCPPQRWLNNLYHGATVLLYHPCSSLHERHLLSALAQSCISDFILTPNKNLHKNRPIALVSWGRTLEVSTVASSKICDWLNTTRSTKKREQQRHKSQYNLLLTRSMDQDQHQEKKGSMKQCCEQTISSLLEDLKKENLHSTGAFSQHNTRWKRAALNSATTNFSKVSSKSTIQQLQSNALPKPISSQNGYQSSTKDTLSQSTSLKENPIPKQLSPNASRTTVNNISLAQVQTMDSHNIEKVQSESNIPAQSDVFKRKNVSVAKDNEVIALEEREVENMKSEHTGSNSVDSAFKSQPFGHTQKNSDCECKPNQVCECNKGAGDQSRAAEVVNQAFPRTPRTDEAVWAAGALGFLLGLLTLSILHTRLYRHWRRGTSLYWRDPQQDYDSVADVIRRRLRLDRRRRKRGRKKECVLLPSSSSSEEYP